MSDRPLPQRRGPALVLPLVLLVALVASVGATPLQSAAPTAPAGPPLPSDTGAVRDGGFEAAGRAPRGEPAPWRIETDGVRFGEARPFRGGFGARLCGDAGCAARLAQTVAPPDAGAGALLLVFHLRIATAKAPGAGCQDELLVEVAVGAEPPATVGRLCEEAATDGFARHRLDLTAIARRAAAVDRPLGLAFVARTDPAVPSTAFWLDDIAIVREAVPPGPANSRVSSGPFSGYSEPHLAVDPTDPDRLLGAAKRFTDTTRYRFRVGTFASADGGRTWTEGGDLRGAAAYEVTSDPVVAFGPDGAAYLVVVGVHAVDASNAPPWAILLYRSDDGGRTFAAPTTVDLGAGNDKPWLAVDHSSGPTRGTVYVGWTRRCVAFFGRSGDGGRSFSPAIRVQNGGPGVQLAVGPGGTLFFLVPVSGRRGGGEGEVDGGAGCGSDRGGEVRLDLVVSGDGGASFAPPRPVIRARAMPSTLDGDFRAGTLPALAVAPDDGALLVAWNDPRDGTPDVWLARSTDGGVSFSDPRRVHPDPANDQF